MGLLFNRRDGGVLPPPPIPAWPGQGSSLVSADSAMRIDAVWACVRLLSDTVAMMPVRAMERSKDFTVPLSVAADQPFWLDSPAEDMSMGDWLRQQMIALLLRGNAYALRVGIRGSAAQRFMPLDPDKVQVSLKDGERVYKVANQVVPTDEVMHLRGYTMPGAITGMSPIAYASSILQTQANIDAFAQGYFSDAPHPAAVLLSDSPINNEQARTIKDRVIAAGGTREPLVLGLGLRMETLSVSAEESQFLETQRLQAARIARIFGVPAEMIGASPGGGMTYSNVTQRAMDFLTYSVNGWLSRFEQALSLALPVTQIAKFDTQDLVRLSPVESTKVQAEYLANGVYTINEVRASKNLPPVHWGDEPYLLAFPTASAMTMVQSEVAKEAEADTLGEDTSED